MALVQLNWVVKLGCLWGDLLSRYFQKQDKRRSIPAAKSW
jgi:hypothetical protein